MKIIIISVLLLVSSCATKTPKEERVIKMTNSLQYSDLKTSLKLCEENNFKECERAGKIYEMENNDLMAKNFFEKACQNKIGTACFALGTLVGSLQPNSSLSLEKANLLRLEHFKSGCALNEFFSCYSLIKNMLNSIALHDQESVEVKNALDLATKTLKFTCDNKISSACKLLENNLRPYEKQAQDEIFDMCTVGIIEGCEVINNNT